MGNHRVVVTGVGVISALGRNSAEFWQGICDGKSGIAPIESVDRTALRFENGAEVRGFDSLNHFEEKQLVFLDRFAQFALIAAREAAADARLTWTDELRERSAVVTGSCVGGAVSEDDGYRELYREGRPRMNPMMIPRIMDSAAASHISVEFGITGPSLTISTACASSTHAIGNAFWMVRQGTACLAIAGGSEAPFSFGNLKAWEALRTVAPDTCRPFSKHRRGMILGEGGAMLVIESLDNARARDATIYAEIVGFGMSADASHLTQPSAAGAARAMRAALKDAEINPDRVGYINAHGTGTQINDATETRAIRSVFGQHANRIAVSSTKAAHGHALGATGAIEAAAAVFALRDCILPPTVNFIEPDPECDLDVVPNHARSAMVDYALSNSFAFGGLNAVLVFRRWNDDGYSWHKTAFSI